MTLSFFIVVIISTALLMTCLQNLLFRIHSLITLFCVFTIYLIAFTLSALIPALFVMMHPIT